MSKGDRADGRALRLARWWAFGRLALGGAAVARPALIGKLLAVPNADAPIQQYVVRNVGGRDIALSVPLLFSLRRRGRPRVWIAMAMLVDALDLASAFADWSNLPTRQRRMIAVSAGGSALTGAVLVGIIRGRRESA